MMSDVIDIIDVIFDPDVEHLDVFPHGLTCGHLFDMFCSVFEDGCKRTSRKVTFDDLLFVKSRLRKCNVVCTIETLSYEDPMSFPLTLFMKLPSAELQDCALHVMGDAVYRVTFVPRFQQQHRIAPGCF